jgi:ubiquinone/menaquinone biosynthesis C-methylase UbiE
VSASQYARQQAQLQWNTTACGELSGDKDTLEYFQNVEQERYAVQDWMHDYFNFAGFSGKKVLEIGVGQGTDLVEFATHGATCCGIDITRQHLQLTEKNFLARNLTVELKDSDATDIKYDNSSFDCVYSFGVLHHIPEIERCIAETNRVLKPGGTFYMGLYYRWSAFHLFRMIVFEGILRGGFYRLCWCYGDDRNGR